MDFYFLREKLIGSEDMAIDCNGFKSYIIEMVDLYIRLKQGD